MLLAPVRSGTTAFLHQLSQSSYVDTATGVIREEIRKSGHPNYSIYRMSSRHPFLVYKASFGHRSEGECSYNTFRSTLDIDTTRPVFLFRDPVQTLNSWRRAGWIGSDLRLFFRAYHWALTLHRQTASESSQTRCVTYELLAADPASIFPQIFEHWGIPFDDGLLAWRTTPGDGTIKHSLLNAQRAKMALHIDQGVHRTLIDGPAAFRPVVSPVILTDREVEAVNRELRDQYSALNESWQRPCHRR